MKLVLLDNDEKSVIDIVNVQDDKRPFQLQHAGAYFMAARFVPATESEPQHFIYRLVPK